MRTSKHQLSRGLIKRKQLKCKRTSTLLFLHPKKFNKLQCFDHKRRSRTEQENSSIHQFAFIASLHFKSCTNSNLVMVTLNLQLRYRLLLAFHFWRLSLGFKIHKIFTCEDVQNVQELLLVIDLVFCNNPKASYI